MGCGASAAKRYHDADGHEARSCIDTAGEKEETPRVLLGTPRDKSKSPRGPSKGLLPCEDSSHAVAPSDVADDDTMQPRRVRRCNSKEAIVKGLVVAAKSIAESNPSAAAGLVTTAAAVAESIPVVEGTDSDQMVGKAAASKLAATATVAAGAKSASAPGLVKTAAAAAESAARARSMRTIAQASEK